MARKVTDGPVRNKERTKKNLVDALGEILKNDGFSGVSISRVAEKAKVDRRLIYDYFGGLEGLVKEYLNNKDYWKISPEAITEIVESSKVDDGKAFAYQVLENQFNSLMSSEEMRRIITWGLSEKSSVLKELDSKRENIGDQLLREIFDKTFNDSDKNFRAIYAILMGGVYYLTLHSNMQENPFCGINLQEPSGQEEIKKTLKTIIELAYT
ncbi:TetR family transcriptional regulator [Pedobacter sp. Leaf41]|uniref:TetR/AcrR family transcriptional regulator n=1 Tax=Pedobacter sp. Leaf41 TaxID=1736218 RepID=UPI0007037BB7|nr:TetR/AcrR family transcriptional regulator [Pedobacter sp. Leaf41]KQN36392.1 TetR family transcriptional regulator [Pedobacter sp. Leaf41]RZL64307.1 MAG: TetR/AcrR family transcriptional regulator [Pedobacter sp.]